MTEELSEAACGYPFQNGTASWRAALHGVFRNLLREHLHCSPGPRRYLLEQCKWSENELNRAPIGYYPSVAELAEQLRASGFALESEEVAALLDGHCEKHLAWLSVCPDGRGRPWGFTHERGHMEDLFKLPAPLSVPAYLSEAQALGGKPVLLVSSPLSAARLIANGLPAVATGNPHITADHACVLAKANVSVCIVVPSCSRSGRASAERSLMRLVNAGVVVSLLEGPDENGGLDCTDGGDWSKAIQHALAENRRGAGAWIADQLLRQQDELSTEQMERKADTWCGLLAGSDRADFCCALQYGGVTDGHRLAAALRLAARLLEQGESLQTVTQIVARSTDCMLTIDERRKSSSGN